MYNETLADCIAEANEDRERRLAAHVGRYVVANGPAAKWNREWRSE
jgi:hypothetical protein